MSVAAAVTSLLVLAGGVAATWGLTDGLRAFTTESARRLSVEQSPRPIPAVGWRPALAPRLGEAGPVRIVDFIYTRCPSVCQSLGGTYGLLQRELTAQIERGTVQLVSVGFDLEHDTPAALQSWHKRHGGGSGWQTTTPAAASDLERLQQVFGLYIRPDDAGGFVHNAALSIVDRHGRLVAVYDTADWKAAAERARRLADHDS